MIHPVSEGCPPLDERESKFSSLGDIDRIGVAFCRSARDPQYVADVQRYRSFRMRCLTTTLAIVDACHIPDHAAVSVRLKRLDSIRRKIGRAETRFTLGRLDDVIGVRVICQDLSTVMELSRQMKASPYFYRVKDYITSPAKTGYRGINHIMWFQQPVTVKQGIKIRFEIQIRTYLQHCWAVWSESHGEAVKLGVGAEEEHEHLRVLSEKINEWETSNHKASQIELPLYSGGRSVAVCWRTRYGQVIPHYFYDEVQNAVDWLNYLESTYSSKRENALVLVGVTETAATEQLLRLTHPLFTGAQVPDPEYWMPVP